MYVCILCNPFSLLPGFVRSFRKFLFKAISLDRSGLSPFVAQAEIRGGEFVMSKIPAAYSFAIM